MTAQCDGRPNEQSSPFDERPMELRPEPVPFRISTLDLTLVYREQNASAQVNVEAQTLEDYAAQPGMRYRSLQVDFELVHEARCRGGNFHEMRHGEIFEETGPADETAHWRQTGLCPFPGFYRVIHDPGLAALLAHYDPRNVHDLQLFILAAHDSYIEVLAKGYRYTLAGSVNEHDIITVAPSA